MNYTVLVVDDDKLVNEFLVETLQRCGYDCCAVYSGEEALTLLKKRQFDIILADLKMKEIDGITLLKHARELYPDVVYIIMTAYGTVETAVKAIKLGAYDFLLKPVLPETIEHILNRVTEMLKLRSDNEIMRKDLADRFHNLIGKSKAMKEVFDLITSVADARSTVMITGASGTGKELVARAIHYASNRKDQPFIKLNCAALPENLVEAELFGYEKGAFTDAKKTNRGRFELADGGTLLLDEISEMPMNLQSKLLRVIQEREFERIGSSTTIAVDVRIIATSNRNLKEYISAGNFREDLFYRLNVIPIHLCPLQEKKEDIPLLVQHFIKRFNEDNNRDVERISNDVLNLFMNYHWPGNVRELENLIERAVVTSKNKVLTEDDFPTDLILGPVGDELPSLKVPMKLEEGSKYLILKTLEKYNGNKTKAAEALGITTRTIRNKLAEYKMQD
ncbi:MAG: sigma-54-dependent Fis family transcriptional regulator [Candidatus Zixiibacteriota bacterium]|nr:MAG: sigma-54-dependent Fis family transcriptional regulator [candidate division Zixibacteria bacterium]